MESQWSDLPVEGLNATPSSSYSSSSFEDEDELSPNHHHDAESDEYREEEEDGEKAPFNGRSRIHHFCGGDEKSTRKSTSRKAAFEREWNRTFLLVSAAGLFVDPLFFYALSISKSGMCLFIDGWFSITVTALRCMADAFHLWNILIQIGNLRKNPDRPRFLLPCLDLIVLLPLPQVVLWAVIPHLMTKGSGTSGMTLLLTAFLFQYLLKIYHSLRLLRRTRTQKGYVFKTIWWGITLNMLAYFVASHAAGACWYLLGIQRSAKCLHHQCATVGWCGPRVLSCKQNIFYGTPGKSLDEERMSWARHVAARKTCLESPDNYTYGAYKWVVQLVANENRVEKILLPIFWGLMTLSTFGNLETATEWVEVVFDIIVITSGLLLVTMLIGNIKVFLHSTTSKKQAMILRMRTIEWWMRKRRLPAELRNRVVNHERQKWAAMRGVDESDIIRHLPENLRRDIKYHLCLDLIKQVPLFQHMDELVLENICDRVKSLIFTKGETVTREGDPVRRMVFVLRGHLQSSHVLRDGVESCCMLGPGNFAGDELLTWCLRRPFVERLPPSTSTMVTVEMTEAFALEAEDLKYVTWHFRYVFVNERVKRSARYYSPGWRTWAAVAVQLAWRRYKNRMTLTSLSFIRPRRPLSRSSSVGEERLRLYTALLTSPKPTGDCYDRERIVIPWNADVNANTKLVTIS